MSAYLRYGAAPVGPPVACGARRRPRQKLATDYTKGLAHARQLAVYLAGLLRPTPSLIPKLPSKESRALCVGGSLGTKLGKVKECCCIRRWKSVGIIVGVDCGVECGVSGTCM